MSKPKYKPGDILYRIDSPEMKVEIKEYHKNYPQRYNIKYPSGNQQFLTYKFIEETYNKKSINYNDYWAKLNEN